MTKYEFIFSDLRKHRLARHMVFWVAWWFSFAIFFHWPIHTFNGWNITESRNPNIQSIGYFPLILKTLFINSLVAVVLPQIFFCYLLIYWLLPGFFYKKRKMILTGIVVVSILTAYILLCSVFKYSVPFFNYHFGAAKTLSPFRWLVLIQIVIRDQITTLPIVASVVLMIKLLKRWWYKQKETEQLAKEKTTAELQLLKAQIHPHFLFNTLNNIYFFIMTNSSKAPEMILKLSGMLRYILNECNQPMVSLDRELSMIADYMALEQVRYGEQLQMTIELPRKNPHKLIAPLVLIPFVENCFKHGASKMITHPWIHLCIRVENDLLYFSLINSRPSTKELPLKGNIGLKNVKKRLQLLYQDAHSLNISSKEDSFAVDLQLVLQDYSSFYNKEINSSNIYELA